MTSWRYRGSNTCSGSTPPGSSTVPSGNIGITAIATHRTRVLDVEWSR